MTRVLSLLLWIAVFEVVAFAIGQATQPGLDGWYLALQKPPLVPPNIVFPIVWTILYAMIAAAGWNIWQMRSSDGARPLLALFAVYTALNWSWSFVFFGAQLLLAGFLWILVLNAVSIALIFKCRDTCRPAALLMIPPTLWTLFAAYLAGGYWWLNGG